VKASNFAPINFADCRSETPNSTFIKCSCHCPI